VVRDPRPAIREKNREEKLMKIHKDLRSLCFIAALTVLAAWFILRKEAGYASNFHQPRRSSPQEAASMQKAFEAVVNRRDVKMPLDKQKEIAKLFHELDIWQNMWFLGIPI
jgi:hypothetical protein